MKRIYSFLFMVLLVAGFSAAQAGTLYKWVDSQGRVSYHDQPPPEGSGYRVEEKNLGSGKKSESDDNLEKIVEKYPVILYSVPVCGSCDLARIYLQKRKVPYSEQNLENNGELQQTLKAKIGSLSAPIVMIGEKVMKGYVESILEGELDAVGYPKSESAKPAGEESKEQDDTSTQGDSGYRPARSRY
ncbi:MAG: glutaredoxin family protein [Sulfuricaulis sp.]|uniref:glutaredoxin family protein n=1 Tax=Sulfuricaulis sp. TaxID=2003553 RepID=UPI0025F89DB3|nr:glutaredoxin family protein [Sulfuricaulis sp.]MCR4346337.1 glutaredoxin family protein [Sulfuricaulis sp.]